MYEAGTFVGLGVVAVFVGYVIYRVVKARKSGGGSGGGTIPKNPPGDQKPR